MSAETTHRPQPGQCWMCDRRDTVPDSKRGRMPELCSTPCEQGWAARYEITHEAATHTATDDGWVPLAAADAPPDAPVEAPEVEANPAPPGTWWAGIRERWVW